MKNILALAVTAVLGFTFTGAGTIKADTNSEKETYQYTIEECEEFTGFFARQRYSRFIGEKLRFIQRW